MKTKLFKVLMMSVAACGFVACSKDMDSIGDGNNKRPESNSNPKVYTMNLSFGGDFISEYEEPLRSGETAEGDTYVGINVFRTKKSTGASEEKYGYGVYKYEKDSETGSFNKENATLKISLLGGYTYRIQATVLTEWTDKMAIKNSSFGSSGDCYSYPFVTKTQNDAEGNDFLVGKIGSFYPTYDLKYADGSLFSDRDRPYLPYLKNGKTYANHGGDWNYSSYPSNFLYPRVKRYYGELKNYDPETVASSSSVQDDTVDLSYQCFGVKIIVVDLPNGNKLKVRDKKEPIELEKYGENQDYLLFPKNLVFDHDVNNKYVTQEQTFDNAMSYESLFSLNSLGTSEELGDKTVNFKLHFRWETEDGNLIQEFESDDIVVSPKKRKIIKVTLSEAGNIDNGGNVKLNFVDEDVLTDDKTIVEVTNESPK